MVIYIISIVIYVFFVYGVIAFIKNVYMDFVNKRKENADKRIQILIDEKDNVELLVKMLKKDFNHIVLILKDDIQNIDKLVDILSKDVKIEYGSLANIRRVEKS